MPCPFFLPSEPCDQTLWPFPARLPLGSGYAGRCTAPDHEGSSPDQDELRRFCNLGYSSACSRLPEQRHADANRFFVAQSGSELIVTFCSERNHAPVEHSVLRFNTVRGTWTVAHGNACVQRQAECAVESFLRRRHGLVTGHDSVVPGFSPGCKVPEHRAVNASFVTGHDFSRAVSADKDSGVSAPTHDHPEASGPTTNGLVSAEDRPEASGPKTDDLSSSHPPILPVEVPVS